MRKWLTIGLLTSSLISYSQNEEIDLEQFSEYLFQVQDENIPYEDIYESLFLYYTNKLNLNKVGRSDLESLYILSPGQLTSFFDYRERFGNFISINELQAVPLFDLQTIRSLIPFVTIQESYTDNRSVLQRIIDEENNYFLLRYTQRLEKQLGYTSATPLDTALIANEQGVVVDTAVTAPQRYLGSPAKIYGRFRTSHKNDFSLGFTFEKDAGESFAFTDRKAGFDFVSYHLLLEKQLGLDKIMLGDFQLQAGQGLVFGAGFNAGKGAETVNTTTRSTIGLRPYTSVLESGFFRGIGLTKKVGDFEVTGFYSRTRQDGNVKIDSLEYAFIFNNELQNLSLASGGLSDVFAEEFANSIITSGLHRTPGEVERRHTIKEESFGGLLTFAPERNWMVGLSGMQTSYSVPIGRTPNNYNQFEFRGKRNQIASAFSNYTWQNLSFFGEIARSSSGGIGAVGGLVTSLSSKVDFAFVFRNYDRDFHSFYGNAFAESSRNINERGTYWGIAIKPNRRHRLNFYYDRFSFPWLKFRTEAPSSGNEWLIRYTHLPSRKIKLYGQLRQQTRQETIANENLNILADQVRINYLFNIDYTLGTALTLKTRIQGSMQNEASVKTRGFAMIQDVNVRFWKLRLHTRTALFETDDFDNAQYAYENDVLYAFSIPAYQGSGIRNYVMIRYNPVRNLSLWLRYARTTFPGSFGGQSTVGSGLDLAEGNTSSELKAMLRLKF